MHIVFDMQDVLEKANDIKDLACVAPAGVIPPALKIEKTEDVNSIRLYERLSPEAGISIAIAAIEGTEAGDRIIVTGRVGSDAPHGSWGIALLSGGADDYLAQMPAPKSVFALSYILGKNDLKRDILLQTTRWGFTSPNMDILVDNISIIRNEKSLVVPADTRYIVYSLKEDPDIQWVGEQDSQILESSEVIQKSGNSVLKIFRRGTHNALYVGNRFKIWDAVDISLEKMGLLPGNNYQITVSGRVDGNVPKGAQFMLQGMPGHSRQGLNAVDNNKKFTLAHTLTQAQLKEWKFIRVTSDSTAVAVPFYIYSIKIKRLG
ncbi:MAG: hypothetical protein FWB91_09405 [Defluviitaleaceae bacterium]|nr:hypothetical protein [Defluviitaleaceae bacterium]